MGLAGRGRPWLGSAGYGRQGWVSHVWAGIVQVGQGMAGEVWYVMVGPGEFWFGLVRHGALRHGRRVVARSVAARCGDVRSGMVGYVASRQANKRR